MCYSVLRYNFYSLLCTQLVLSLVLLAVADTVDAPGKRKKGAEKGEEENRKLNRSKTKMQLVIS